MTAVSVLFPYAPSGDEWRRRAWEYVCGHYTRHHPTWQRVVGTCRTGRWSKGEAVANALRAATGDVLVVADADSFVDPVILRACAHTATWAVPHGLVYRLARSATEQVYAGQFDLANLRRAQLYRRQYTGPLGGGIVVLTRTTYEAVGGIDPRFQGWGGEDIAFGWALHTLVGPGERLGAPLVHLWHPHPAPNRRGCHESEALAGRYRDARGDAAAMAALVTEHQGVIVA